MQRMMGYLGLILLWAMVLYASFTQAWKFDKFDKDVLSDGYVCTGTDVVFEITLRVTLAARNFCLLECSKNFSCLSVFFDPESGNCTGCAAVYQGQGGTLINSAGTVYFRSRRRFFDQSCNTEQVCIGDGQVCWGSRCLCPMGYSFDYNTYSCVTHCTVYGNTFQKYANWRITGFNDFTQLQKSLTACRNACYARSYCLSIEYTPYSCHVSSETPLTKPDVLEYHDNTDLYMRNCE